MSVIRPFKIAIPQSDLDELRARLARTRWPGEETVDDWRQGPRQEQMQQLCDYWRTEYDWRRCEATLNRFDQFLISIDGIDIHFLHVRSAAADAVPMLLAHGWPGSILEFARVIGPLSNPVAHGVPHAPAFHLILPTMPGFGFSGKPVATGWDINRIADAYMELMRRLGYEHWICHGGDLGSAVAEAIAHRRPPGCAGIHLNMSFFEPTPDEVEDADETERFYLARSHAFFDEQSAYYAVQSTRPQTIAYSLADSPVGQAAWIFDKLYEGAQHDGDIEEALSRDDVLDNITLYWLTNSGGSAARLYWELRRSRGTSPPPPITLPTAYSGFAGETILASRRWLEKRFKRLVYYKIVSRGGHFAAWEQPQLFAREIRAMLPALIQGKP
jgi:pimeloyl-ACP methyl ester carboxylesterase